MRIGLTIVRILTFLVIILNFWLALRKFPYLAGFSLVFFLLGIFVAAGFLAPFPTDSRKRLKMHLTSFRLLLKYFLTLNPRCFYVSKGVPEERVSAGFLEHLWHPSGYSSKQSLIWVESDSAAALEIFVTPSKFINPSFTFRPALTREGNGGEGGGAEEEGSVVNFTRKYERIKGCLDLRPQRKTRSVKAITRDGVEIEMDLTLDMGLVKPRGEIPPRIPYPIDPEKALQAVYIRAVGEEEVDWRERAFSIVANYLSQLVSRYTVRQLYGNATGTFLYERLERELREELLREEQEERGKPQGAGEGEGAEGEAPQGTEEGEGEGAKRRVLRRVLEDMGVQIIDVRISPLKVPKEVLQQTLTNWEARLAREQAVLEAEADVSFWTEMERVKAQALQEIAESVFKSFAEMQLKGMGREVIVLRLIKMLQEIASHPLTRALLPTRTRGRLSEFGILRGLTESGN